MTATYRGTGPTRNAEMRSRPEGRQLPEIVTPPPGPQARELARMFERFEAPGVNTVLDGQPSIAWQSAVGANVTDVDGNRYIDLAGGFGAVSVGHRHPRVVEAIDRQSRTLIHGLGDVHSHRLRAELAARLCELAPVDDPKVYFAVSGADAIEIAVKTAVMNGGAPGVVAFDASYHGCTLGALSITSQSEFRAPFQALLNQHVRFLPYGGPEGRLDEVLRGGGISCVVVEPIAGRGGSIVPPAGWLGSIARVCRDRGVILVVDEVLTGFGRTGHWFACEADEVRPDLLCCGKALGGGVPIAAVVGRSPLMEAWRTAGECLHATTFLGHPLACAASLAALDVMREERLAARAGELGTGLESGLRGMCRRIQEERAGERIIEDLRGRGLMWGIEVSSVGLAGRWGHECLQRGVLVLAGGSVMRLDPPLTITEEQLEVALQILEVSLRAALARGE